MNNQAPAPATTSDIQEPSFFAAAGGRFTLFFLWLLPIGVFAVLFNVFIFVVWILAYASNQKNMIILVPICGVAAIMFICFYILSLKFLKKKVSAVHRKMQGPEYSGNSSYARWYFIINIFLGPIGFFFFASKLLLIH